MKTRIFTLFIASICVLASCSKSQELTGTTSLLFPKDGNPRWVKEFTAMNYLLLSSGITVYAGESETVADQVNNLNALKVTGATSVVFTSVDPNSDEIAQALSSLRSKGVKIICYDRLQMNTPDVDLYISASSRTIGELQAAALAELPEGAKIEILSGDPRDRNASELFEGTWGKLRPNVEGGKKWVIPSGNNTFVNSSIGSWSALEAGRFMSTVLDQYYADGTMPDAIICANDVIAQEVIALLQKRFNTIKLPIIVGQDNTEKSRELIADGLQRMTVDKNMVEYVNSAIDAVFKYQSGNSVAVKTTTNNGLSDIPTIAITPLAVYKNNLIDSGK